MDDGFITVRMPTAGKGVWGDPLRQKYQIDLDKRRWRRHYRTFWYGKQLKHPWSPLKRFLYWIRRRSNQIPRNEVWVEVCIKDCPDEIRNYLLSQDDVHSIETPKEYRW